MITPAVLISACGSMILSTSSRLGRVVDRVRALSDKLEELAGKNAAETKERQGVIFAQLDKLTSRARILQRSMVAFYLATGFQPEQELSVLGAPMTYLTKVVGE